MFGELVHAHDLMYNLALGPGKETTSSSTYFHIQERNPETGIRTSLIPRGLPVTN